MPKISRISRNALLVFSLFGVDKVLAFVRAGIVSRAYREDVFLLDTFNAANNLPDVLFALISGGALAMAFVPLLTEALDLHGSKAVWELFSRVLNFTFLLTAAASLLIAWFAEPLAQRVIAPGFSAQQLHLLAQLMRLNLLGTLLFSISGLVMAALHAHQHFLLPGLAPSAYNLGQIFGALFLVPRFGIHGLVYGVILGAALHLLIQIPGLLRCGFHWTASLDLRNSGLLHALWLLWPRIVTMAGIQAIVILRDNFASRLGQEGAVTALTYGWMLMQVPETLLGTAVATALLPALSQLAADANWKGFYDTLERAWNALLALSLPIAAVGAAGLGPLSTALFDSNPAQNALIAWTARAYLLTLSGYVLQEVAARAAYARQKPLWPLASVLLRLSVFVSILQWGTRNWPQVGAPMIALGEMALLLDAGLLLLLLSREPGRPLQWPEALLRGGIAALLGGAVTLGLTMLLPLPPLVSSLLAITLGGLTALSITAPQARQLLQL